VERYGKAAETWTEPFQTVGGGDHTNEIHLWSGDKMVIRVDKFGASTQECAAMIVTRELYDQTAEE
jgi:hypothetical protein